MDPLQPTTSFILVLYPNLDKKVEFTVSDVDTARLDHKICWLLKSYRWKNAKYFVKQISKCDPNPKNVHFIKVFPSATFLIRGSFNLGCVVCHDRKFDWRHIHESRVNNHESPKVRRARTFTTVKLCKWEIFMVKCASGTQIPLNYHSKRNNACSNFVPCHIFLSRDIQ